MGDNGLFRAMNLIGAYYKPEPVLLQIGSHFTLTPPTAPEALVRINA